MKKSYPLPRDIVARILSNIGIEALSELKTCLQSDNRDAILEGVDAVGFITFYNTNDLCLDDLFNLTQKYKKDDLMMWKLLRCLQSFESKKSREILTDYLNSSIKQLSWEARRSISQLDRKLEEK